MGAEITRAGPPSSICQKGQKLSEGVAAWLRHEGVPAELLAGGSEAWGRSGLPYVPVAKLPPRDAEAARSG